MAAPRDKQLAIVVTGAGAPGIAGTIHALRNNPDGVATRIVSTDIQLGPVGRYLADAFHQLPAPEHSDYLPALLDVCRRESAMVVLPQTTREIAFLATARELLQDEGIDLVAPSRSAVELGNNKLSLLDEVQRAPSLRKLVPKYRLTRDMEDLEAAAHELGYPGVPVVVKPCVSNGMRGFRVLREQAWDVRRFLAEKPSGTEIPLSELLDICSTGGDWPELLVTEYLPGVEYSVDAFVGRHTSVAVPRLRRVIRSGISFENVIELRQDLIDATLAVAERLGLGSAFGLQFKLDAAGDPKLLECNPRVQGTMVASCFAGVNIIWLAVREAQGDPATVELTKLRPAEFLRYWGGVGVVDGDVHVI